MTLDFLGLRWSVPCPMAVMTRWTPWGLRWSSRLGRASQMVSRHCFQLGGLALHASAVVTGTSCLCSSWPSACLYDWEHVSAFTALTAHRTESQSPIGMESFPAVTGSGWSVSRASYCTCSSRFDHFSRQPIALVEPAVQRCAAGHGRRSTVCQRCCCRWARVTQNLPGS